MAVYWYVSQVQPDDRSSWPVLLLPCYFNWNSSSLVYYLPQAARKLLRRHPGQAIVEVRSEVEDIGLEELDRQHIGT